MGVYKTSRGRPVQHCHIRPCWNRELTSAERSQIRALARRQHPNAREVGQPTRTYNCHGHGHANKHAWFNDPSKFIRDDYLQQTMAQPRVNDVVVYVKNGSITHSGKVHTVSGKQITSVRSKWGQWGEYIHALNDVPSSYGAPIYLLRRR